MSKKEKNPHAQFLGNLSHEAKLKKWGPEGLKKKMKEASDKRWKGKKKDGA